MAIRNFPQRPARLRATFLSAAALLLALPLAAPGRAADPPATLPAAPASQPGLRLWVQQLRDKDPSVREQARVQLMGLGRAQLDQLRDAVALSRPLGPGQAAELREIVSHVYLAGETYESAGNAGFLGVEPSRVSVDVAMDPGGDRGDGEQVGIVVVSRIPGFCGYRMLQDGDIILRIRGDQPVEMRTAEDLRNTVSRQRPGDTISMDILRRGKLLQVPITLDRRPAWADTQTPDEALGPLERRAQDYWDRAFAPLLADQTS